MDALVPTEYIEQRIFYLRGAKLMIDRDLSELYDVETKYLNRQVKRNAERFPPEFIFQLNQSK
ncbi:MAG: ORF6N domain-containing protein [Candidatus Heimdallarchaeota archaeon]|nr:ORF6N domain-containing protein [Candidatus Heimdallarchaeota archaeon]